MFPVGDQDPALAALIEPVSIAMRTVVRGRVAAGEHVVILGAGPIGQALALAATDRGASVLLVDTLESRLARGSRERGRPPPRRARTTTPSPRHASGRAETDPRSSSRRPACPALVQTAIELVAQAGRVVVVGLSSEHTPIRVGDLPFKEIDVLGVSCCGSGEFAAAVDLVGRRRDAAAGLVTHEFTLEQAPEAIAYAMRAPGGGR